MLYDPKWETKADPLELATLIAWIETKRPTEPYKYTDSAGCLLTQYFRAMGFRDAIVGSKTVSYYPTNSKSMTLYFPEEFNRIAYGACDAQFLPGGKTVMGWTFGQALRRARALGK